MIIKNNFNEKNVNPLSDYQSINKTRDNSSEKEEKIIQNQVIQDIMNLDQEYEEDNEEVQNKWDFFK